MKTRFQGMLVLAGVLFAAGTAFPAEQNPAREEAGAVAAGEGPAAPGTGLRYEPQGLVLYDNGPIVTHPGGGAGGADASALQTNLGMTVFGFGHAQSAGIRVADDFTVPAGETWSIDRITFFAYQTGAGTGSPTINHVNLQIWNGNPSNPASMVVFGDTTTNRLASSVWSNAYRVLDTGLTNTQRPVFANVVTVGTTLTAGTYWLDWQTGGTLASGPWVPPVTILGQTTTGNGLQKIGAAAWAALIDVGPQGLPFILESTARPAPAGLAVDPTGNGVLQPNEAAVSVVPTWANNDPVAIANVAGVLSNFSGPPVATYTINDSAATYGTIAANSTATCGADCYAVTVTAAARPVTHWDATALETVTPGPVEKTWTLHIGDSFTDVPASNPFYRFIEILLHRGVTSGCTLTEYCPSASTSREQMAVFALVAKEGQGYAPPLCTPPNLFNDVPETSPFCRWIEELANRGVVAGCGGGDYCPTRAVTREEMAIFMLRTLDPTLVPAACAPPNVFNDVPETSPFCRWIEELAARGVVGGCGGGNYCPADDVSREQMGVFIAATFGLTLYGL
jgi:hypothetical protein